MIKQLQDCLYLLDRRDKVRFALLGLMMLVAAGLEILSIGLVLPFLQLIEDPAKVMALPVLGKFLEGIAAVGRDRLLIYAAALLFGIVVFKNLFLIGLLYVQFRIAFNNERALSERLYRVYMKNPFVLAMQRNSAELIRNVYAAVSDTVSGSILGFVSFFTETLVVIAIIALLLSLHPVAALAAALMMATALGSYQILIRQRFTIWGEKSLVLDKEIMRFLQQGLHSLKTTRVHGKEYHFINGFGQAKGNQTGISAVIHTANNSPRLWVETVFLASVLLVIIVLLKTTPAEGSILPVLGLFAAAAFRIMPSINRMIMAFNNIKRSRAALQSVFKDIREYDILLRDEKRPETEPNLGPIESLRFEDVSFHYPNTKTAAIHGLSLDIAPGQSIGLVGPSGAGKTTLVDILLGLMPPTQGRVTVNGTALTRIPKQWAKRLGYVPQSVYILDDTLRRNVAFAMPDEAVDDDAVWAALNRAQLDDFVKTLPDGLDTVLGEHGARLSGGQQQRIGIARALYHDPEVLVLDEATSALDKKTEQAFNEAIGDMKGDKTLIVIAHRLSTVRQCDRLVYLKDGRLADIGTFDELTARNDAFRNLVELSKL